MDQARVLIGDQGTPATVLHAIILKKYGAEYIYGDHEHNPVDPIVLWNTVEDDFRISIPLEVENKLNAVMTACATDYFFTDPEAFSAICMSISSGSLGDDVSGAMDVPSVFEMLCSIQEVELNDGDKEVTFSHPVRELIQSIFDQENVESEGDIDAYTQDLDNHMILIQVALESIGAPREKIVMPKDGDLYGLLSTQ